MTSAGTVGLRYLMHQQGYSPSVSGEQEKLVLSVSHQHLVQRILDPSPGGLDPLIQGMSRDQTLTADDDQHLLVGQEVAGCELALAPFHDLSSPGVGVPGLDLLQLLLNQSQNPLGAAQDALQATDELELDDSSLKEEVTVSLSSTSSETLAVFELNVRGFRLPNALRSVEKQLDAALVQGITSFTILHGKGHGILQQGIHDYLKMSPYVKDYYFTRPEEGGTGKTVVILKV